MVGEAQAMVASLPDRIDLGDGLVLERVTVAHADGVARAVAESLDHLRPFVPWANAASALVANQRARLRVSERMWKEGREHQYAIASADADDDPVVVGMIGLVRSDRWRIGRGVVEIGYWVHVDWCNRGVATRATRAVTDAAFTLPGVKRVVVVVDAANDASNAVPRKLGYTIDRVVDQEPQAPGETGRMQVWVRSGAETPLRGTLEL